ncbi:hypothetical protein KR222_007549 [Zaprionus bogoriensis]|nr:hypothetical protein KR222_007549 [Zaprionus bogoriensis]
MIITVKNLQQQTFSIDFDPEKTVLELKKLIFRQRGADYIVEKQKLIYAGIILSDDRTINSYKVDEKKFIVVMLTRDIVGSAQTTSDSPAKHPATGVSQKVTATNLPTENKAAMKKEESKQKLEEKTCKEASEVGDGDGIGGTETADVATLGIGLETDYSSINLVDELANASLQTRAESNLLMGEEYNRTVASMVEMGYGREQVERAMAASFNNPERAVEYLIQGIPQEEPPFNSNSSRDPSTRASNIHQATMGDLLTESANDPFEFLRNQPQFLQMRSLIYQNPHLLHAVLQQIGQTNPALLQLISENQDAFLNMLNQPLEGEVLDNAQRIGRLSVNQRHSESLESSANLEETIESQSAEAPRNLQVSISTDDINASTIVTERRQHQHQTNELPPIRLTAHDQEAIDRLKALGFPEALALQAYFACEKNEELAANFLISSNFDD